MDDKRFVVLTDAAVELGAFKAAVIPTDTIVTDRVFRDLCAQNACGMYGRCHMCPPDVGGIDELMAQVTQYDHALVYQTVTALEDSYDFEGMVEAKRRLSPLSQHLRRVFEAQHIPRTLHLGAGGCGVCDVCAKQTGKPCRSPDLALPSLEVYGINVSQLATAAGMRYINGADTVTYFGAVLFSFDGE